jgi:hypothetical protein
MLTSAGGTFAGAEELPQANGVTGNVLQEYCRSDHDIGVAFCLGFAAAVGGIMSRQEFQDRRACFPNEVTTGQLRDVVTKFLDKNPEQLHHPAESLVALAFAEAFPCPE